MKFLLRLVPHHALALLLLLALASPLCAADYFVATNGNDNNNGLTAARPFRNVARAALLAIVGERGVVPPFAMVDRPLKQLWFAGRNLA